MTDGVRARSPVCVPDVARAGEYAWVCVCVCGFELLVVRLCVQVRVFLWVFAGVITCLYEILPALAALKI